MTVNDLSEFIEFHQLRNPKNGVVIFPAEIEILYGTKKKVVKNVSVQISEQSYDPNITFHNFNDFDYRATYRLLLIENLKHMYNTYLLIEDTHKGKPISIKVIP